MEFVVHPDDANAAGLTDGDWAELSNQFSRCEGVVNVSDEVQRGLISAIFGWQGPSDNNPTGMPQYYANNLVAGGPLQQKSNGAFFKNTRGALRKIDRPPVTAANTPGFSLKDATAASQAAVRQATPSRRPRTSSPGRCRARVRTTDPVSRPGMTEQFAQLSPTESATVGPLRDGWGRTIRSLRVSVTDRCNFRCHGYCMPAEGLALLKPDVLTFEEIQRLVRVMAAIGVGDVRLTGGEPLVRRDLPELVAHARRNARRRGPLADDQRRPARPAGRPMAAAGLRRINVSLDSLSHTLRRDHATRRAGPRAARARRRAPSRAAADQGQLRRHPYFSEVEVPALAELARSKPYVVRFIEFMPLDADDHRDADQVLSGAEIRAIIARRWPLEEPSPRRRRPHGVCGSPTVPENSDSSARSANRSAPAVTASA